MLLKVFKISGHSMMPILNPDDRVLVSSIPYYISPPKVGDIIVFKYGKRFLIKKIIKIEGAAKGEPRQRWEWFEVSGENKNDSLDVGKITREKILGKVIMKI